MHMPSKLDPVLYGTPIGVRYICSRHMNVALNFRIPLQFSYAEFHVNPIRL